MSNVTKEDILSFYESGIFRRELKDTIDKAAERAYRDMCRPLKFTDEFDKEKRANQEAEGFKVLKRRLAELNAGSDKEYDAWLRETANELIGLYGKFFYFGHAQKWINMTMKYLLCFGNDIVKAHEQYLHAPIDRYVVESAQKEFDIQTEGLLPWSRIGEEGKDTELYFNFQDALKEKVKSKYGSVIKWEFSAWSNYENPKAK